MATAQNTIAELQAKTEAEREGRAELEKELDLAMEKLASFEGNPSKSPENGDVEAKAEEEKEAVEVYPAMSRMVDTSNQFHLWVFMDKAPITLGWEKGMVLESQEEADEISHLYNLRKGQTSQRTMEKGFI